ncbi:MAG: CDP-archaeol synthase [Lentisphaerae bacterium]|nr:CDP-archaeol synthase [Lentisphaerota bacterium]
MNLPAIKHRLISGFSIAAVLFSVFFLMPDAAAPFILSALAAVMALEFYRMVSAAGIPNFDRIGMLGCVALIGVTWCTGFYSGGDGAWDSVVIFLVVIGIFLRQFPQKHNPHPLQTIGGTLFGVLYIGLLWNFMAKLLLFGRPAGLEEIYWPGRWLLLYAVFAAKFTDIGAYLVGCAFGRHKLIPRLSPGKSWEGVFGGIVLGTLVGTLLVWGLEFTESPLSRLGLTPLRAIPLGIFLSVCGVVGDLTESLFKRAANVKDSGGVIPGMGGLLDVLDSILFTAPGVYLFLRLVA